MSKTYMTETVDTHVKRVLGALGAVDYGRVEHGEVRRVVRPAKKHTLSARI